jgi:hypothetical protein
MDDTAIRINKKDVLSNTYPALNAIPAAVPIKTSSEKFAMNYLKKFGWKGEGHGLGKESTGISEPIDVQIYNKRQGLGSGVEPKINHEINENIEIGCTKAKKEILNNLSTFLNNYSKSSATNDIIFEKRFSKDERKLFHRIAINIGLKTKSYGVDQDRYLTISKNCSMNEILNHIQENSEVAYGGKFKLLSK